MKDNHQIIKNKLDNFSIDGYDTAKGWERLEQKMRPVKKQKRLWPYEAVAASLITAVLLYWIFAQQQKPFNSLPLEKTIAVEADKKSESINIKNENKYNKIQQIQVEKKPLVINSTNKKNEHINKLSAIAAFPEEKNIKSQPALQKIEETNITLEIKPKMPAAQQPERKPLPIINETEINELLAIQEMASLPKPNKIMKYIIKKAAQQEYTTAKASSQPLQIKF